MGLNAFQLSLCITLLDTAPTKEDDLAQAAWHAATNDFRLFGMPSESQLLAAKHYCCNEMTISAIKRTCTQLLYPPPGIVGKANRKIWIHDAIKNIKNKNGTNSTACPSFYHRRQSQRKDLPSEAVQAPRQYSSVGMKVHQFPLNHTLDAAFTPLHKASAYVDDQPS